MEASIILVWMGTSVRRSKPKDAMPPNLSNVGECSKGAYVQSCGEEHICIQHAHHAPAPLAFSAMRTWMHHANHALATPAGGVSIT
eukprot:1138248-Pelagomonas_calceolata.AAC.5